MYLFSDCKPNPLAIKSFLFHHESYITADCHFTKLFITISKGGSGLESSTTNQHNNEKTVAISSLASLVDYRTCR
jgi:hypothetical protein